MSHKNLNEGIQPIPVEWQKEEQEWNEAIKVSYEKKVRELVAENGQLLEDNVGLRHQIEIGKKEKSELQNALEHAKKSDPEVEVAQAELKKQLEIYKKKLKAKLADEVEKMKKRLEKEVEEIDHINLKVAGTDGSVLQIGLLKFRASVTFIFTKSNPNLLQNQKGYSAS